MILQRNEGSSYSFTVDPDTKKWEIDIGIPSAAALISKRGWNIQKGSGTSGTDWVGDIGIDSSCKSCTM